ncbi:cellular tumor antigen p53 [Gouania willdenowi]|uniref:cellular tumor antigen p53 n=1 Tax=Gouania willdenowi TaxID=441366 RepID=UPI0010549491|nr:cellular tumor antigen p53 [Gouania willdenowi]
MEAQSLDSLQLSQNLPLSQDSFQELWQTVVPPMIYGVEEPMDILLPEMFDVYGLSSETPNTDAVTPSVTTVASSTVPVTTDYPGDYDFQLRFEKSGTAKSVTSTYSELINKLYCQLAKTNPIAVAVSSEPPQGAAIRATAIYKKTEHVAEAVRRCPHHQNEDAENHRSHLIRVDGNQRAQYFEDEHTKRQSVTVPYEHPQTGSKMTTILLKFMCNSSCMGGMNRRPILTILTLESADGQILGRRCFEVRVCACPGRDRKTEEENHSKSQSEPKPKPIKKRKSTPAPDSTSVKKTKAVSSADEEDKEVFVLHVRGRKNFEILKKVNEGLELVDKENKVKAKVIKQELPQPSSGKRLLQRGERSDSD